MEAGEDARVFVALHAHSTLLTSAHFALVQRLCIIAGPRLWVWREIEKVGGDDGADGPVAWVGWPGTS